MTSWLARSPPDRAIRVGALAGDIVRVKCLVQQHNTVPLFFQGYKTGTGELLLGVAL